ncbi:hypothetical protein NA56DRAFT_706680 [Hyaloscypha hepaticicola]|uniref:Uncharacterized protein n=1 Tax=Hyaloscypha hepaticicola TaxID=2082293 RepID=A0A2J6PWY3_9HELO|nr:hypothetical protein NA56DRAFT_706680 [Hyaloscypha hepaticicola]
MRDFFGPQLQVHFIGHADDDGEWRFCGGNDFSNVAPIGSYSSRLFAAEKSYETVELLLLKYEAVAVEDHYGFVALVSDCLQETYDRPPDLEPPETKCSLSAMRVFGARRLPCPMVLLLSALEAVFAQPGDGQLTHNLAALAWAEKNGQNLRSLSIL